jgi:hypothetical protein
MKEKIEIQVEQACDDCVLDFGECHGNPVFLSQLLEKYGMEVTNPKHVDFIILCPERLVPPDDSDD